ncbi:hypothetical protein [Zobellia barbeyronii]|uniref:Alpha/beta hydrolase n=1 Tax=Zobellia barbeyronii TaxID=2748009 RepID=A0ABS5W8W7_9FLAO|nr:hypothetical protein [Zobellia barbeyronii]MBT2159659.1 hypothetical protein [Zobellia barbeyronii]
MKHFSILLFFLICKIGSSQSVEKIVLDEEDKTSGYYLAVVPAENKIEGVLVLLPGFGQQAETIFPETKLHKEAFKNNILTIGFAAGSRLLLEQEIQEKFTKVLQDVIERFSVDKGRFVIGGFSAGGTIALRYTELCLESPENYPIVPKGVFVVDSPIDVFRLWEGFEETIKNDKSEIAVQEAKYITELLTGKYGIPAENVSTYSKMNPFSMNREYGENEVYLKNIAVRTYHDVDISWRLQNRYQSAKNQNFMATSELINRLLILGNERAQFIQTLGTGYRSDGQRHPHSWSIVDEVECIEWVKNILSK